MSRVVAGTLLLPNGQPMANASIYFTAKRTEPVSIIEGSNTFFNTNGAGVYNQTVVNGFYAVSIEYIADSSGAHTRRWPLGDVFIEDGAASTLEALIIASNQPSDLPLTLFYEILADAQQAAADAAASAASITVGTGPTNIPNTTILNTRLGTAGNLGTLAVQDSSDVSVVDLTLAAGGKLRGDFSNAALASRTYVENSVANSPTSFAVKPSGTSTSSHFSALNSSDPANCCRARLSADPTIAAIVVDAVGAAAALPLVFQVGGAERFRITTAGDAGFGLAPDTQAKLQTSNGIKLGNTANANANVLDWYEEGVFTPVVSGSTTAGAGTYSNQIGTFTRVGNRVDFNILLGWSAHSGSGNLTVGGMPFASAAAGPAVFSVSFDGLAVGAGKQLAPHMGINSTSFVFYVCDLAGGAIGTLGMDSSVSSLRVTGTYAC